jgi:periplasmic divalent cation tolerance protein
VKINRLSPNYGIVFVTTASVTEAETIATVLVTEKLAACVKIIPIQSVYVWEGKINRDSEWQLLIKTDLDLFAAIECKIKELHSYTTPEIIAVPIVAGSPAYLSWLGDNVGEVDYNNPK